jgi:L-type amino acid transporter 9
MTVAAANKKWFPAVFGTVGHIGIFKVTKSVESKESAESAMDKGESPMYVYLA